jgi:hypothetical protein
MAAAPPCTIGSVPDAFNGNPTKAESFWNTLENYYTLNHCGNEFLGRCKSAHKYIIMTP